MPRSAIMSEAFLWHTCSPVNSVLRASYPRSKRSELAANHSLYPVPRLRMRRDVLHCRHTLLDVLLYYKGNFTFTGKGKMVNYPST
jgi:hypothetical protein